MQQEYLLQLAALALGACVAPMLSGVEKSMAKKRTLALIHMPKWIAFAWPIACAISFWLTLLQNTSTVQLVLHWFAVALCWIAAVFDLKYRLIPNSVVLGLLATGIAAQLFGCAKANLLSALAGFVMSGILFMVPFVFGKTVGAGDVKLAAAVGFCAGLTGSLGIIVIMGVLILLYTVFAKGTVLQVLHSWVPMGPFVATAYLLFLIK